MRLAKGIERENRGRLELLHRSFTGPFSVAQATEIFGFDREKTRKLLAYFASRGWLSRVRRDAYTVVPLGATAPSDWREDPWVVAAHAFAPCYLGGWTACEHWGLTEQLFLSIVVITGKRVRNRTVEIQGTRFQIKVLNDKKRFGTRPAWRGQNQVQVSDPSRTIVDILDDPKIGGGIRHVADILAVYFKEKLRNDAELIEYAKRLGNRTVFKRLGFLVETLQIAAPQLIEACAKQKSTGLALLDHTISKKGRIVKKWNLRVNAEIKPVETAS